MVSTDSPWYQIKQIRFTKVDFDKVSLGPFSHIGEEILHWQYPLILRSPLHLLIHEINDDRIREAKVVLSKSFIKYHCPHSAVI